MADLPQPGEVVDGFLVGERVHSGGMGVIFRVSGPDTGFPMLMKVPRLGPGEPATSVISFEVEQTVMAALSGPHVPRFVAAGDLDRRPYLVIEEISGPSLKEWVPRAPLPPAEVARLGIALATALHAIHQQDAIHLDLKPANVLFRPTGEAVLIDFGLAHHASYPDLLAEEYRRPIGSAPYISPEQVVGERGDPRSDLFSLGVILYELATGRLPFGSPTSEGGLRRRLWRDPPPLRAVAPDVPEWLQEVVLRCLEPDASRRHASAAQVAFDLAHPDQVVVTERGRRARTSGPLARARRWILAAGYEPAPLARPSSHLAAASIVLAAIATQHDNEAQFTALRDAVRRVMDRSEGRRLACATVIRPIPELGGSRLDETAAHQRLKHLSILRHWAEPLALPAGQVSFHVIESSDPAGALLEYARTNGVDHIVIGAPPPDVPLRGVLGTVSTKVAIEAPCTVTLVRPAR
ncbi:bifunctional serine/threonine-protein kinase/universal stress protein [Anaeromyxobacter oryzae]|uniref:Serine/threonine protein kinase n=1 Tax=Anaeromyxobacter oryzae TaxID=2918170 RepID=A0ABN6MS88_9BACT|nr:bifunctional serine/threonine-protein kinase/universal stress protein [Anaeromyxobacter oryzae]BDG02613.1 serine/threonine protein kinase [Anaeromyxobacter oryzae]